MTGLAEAAAAARLKAEGYNELPSRDRRTLWRLVLEVFREPMFQLLVAAGLIYLGLGDRGEALMLLGFAAVNVAIAVYQEHKTERVLEALRDLTSPRALVIRDGARRRIPGREVVRGDVVVLSEGDRVPADASLLSCHGLQADESLLTGESAPVHKTAANGTARHVRPGGDGLPYVYSGSLIVRGHGLAEVRATGAATEIGKIGRALRAIEPGPTPLYRQTRRLVRVFAALGLSLSVLVVVLYGVTRGVWLEGVLAGITLAMATLPQEFPLVLTVFLVIGARRISQRRVLTRRFSAIEALGAATVLCADKTGTLTVNRMAVSELQAGKEVYAVDYGRDRELPEIFHALLEFGILASARDPFDPMEKAFLELGQHYLAQTEHLHRDWTLVREYGLRPGLLAVSHVWKAVDRDAYVVAAKGAPEAIADLCHLGPAEIVTVRQDVTRMAERGLRVLAVARASYEGDSWPALQHDFVFGFLGLVGLADPLRPAVREAITECRNAGIRVVMVTGDHPATAAAIAGQAGLSEGRMLLGDELARMASPELQSCINEVAVFARIMPEQKLRLVTALKARGEIVAMTGDGVNDAPALKAAQIGIAMGGRGTDVAREAASLVLLDDDFASIVAAIRLGRRIFDNLQKAMAYILAIHVPIAGLSVLPLILGWPPLFFPAHIVFLELVIDPVSSIVFEAEPEERDVMRRPPRDPGMPLFSARMMTWSAFQGAVAMLAILIVLAVARQWGIPDAEVRALGFVTLVVTNFSLIITNRSGSSASLALLVRRNPALWWIAATTLAILAGVLAVPELRNLFAFGPLHADDIGACVLAGIGSFVVLTLAKWATVALRSEQSA
ncbi:MAG TPA: cation-translocating P-type ATPase [Alphaproteobacteria bacterium]|nr:cation-translocating P-type ATPase [Alphaproteobacteria bacterium]